MKILIATIDDWPEIRAIYRDGILTNEATFNTVDDIPTGDDWFAGKIAELTFKMVDDAGKMLGWACVSPVSKRRVYQGIGEDSVYVSAENSGKGIGSKLLSHLITKSEEYGIWTLEAKIFPTHTASINLHKKYGFRIVGTRKKIAQQHGIWRDVALLERRVPVGSEQ